MDDVAARVNEFLKKSIPSVAHPSYQPFIEEGRSLGAEAVPHLISALETGDEGRQEMAASGLRLNGFDVELKVNDNEDGPIECFWIVVAPGSTEVRTYPARISIPDYPKPERRATSKADLEFGPLRDWRKAKRPSQ